MFLNDRILIGVLGGIRVHQSTAINGAVAGVLVPVVVGVQTRVNQDLQDLVGGGVGPLLACQASMPATSAADTDVPFTVVGSPVDQVIRGVGVRPKAAVTDANRPVRSRHAQRLPSR